MRTDSLQQFVKLHRELTEERGRLEARLRQINQALGAIPATSPVAVSSAGQRPRRGRPTAGGGPSLREVVLEVLGEGPKTKEEILDAVQNRGYQFATNNPLNSLGVILYGNNPKFKRVDGKFSRPGGAAVSGQARRGGRRKMSAAARARIAEAQRKRWAASRAGQGNSTSAQGASYGGKPRRKMSAAGRKAIAEAARKRWAAAKAAGKSRL